MNFVLTGLPYIEFVIHCCLCCSFALEFNTRIQSNSVVSIKLNFLESIFKKSFLIMQCIQGEAKEMNTTLARQKINFIQILYIYIYIYSGLQLPSITLKVTIHDVDDDVVIIVLSWVHLSSGHCILGSDLKQILFRSSTGLVSHEEKKTF